MTRCVETYRRFADFPLTAANVAAAAAAAAAAAVVVCVFGEYKVTERSLRDAERCDGVADGCSSNGPSESFISGNVTTNSTASSIAIMKNNSNTSSPLILMRE